jgi:lysylphosphatidylglycerol synthetase-like protein (DUF2156 family)
MTLGIAVIGAIAGGSISGAIGRGFATATHPAWFTIVAFGALILLLGLLTTTRWAEDTAAQTARQWREGEPAAA